MAAGQDTMRAKTLAALREATRDGELPIVCDASSCTEGLRQAVESDVPAAGQRALRMVDAVDFAAERILPRLPAHGKLESLALHPTCSSTRLGLNDALDPSPVPSPTGSRSRKTGAVARSRATAACCTRN